MEFNIKPDQVIDNRYRMEHPIGSGGYGHVWKAWHEVMHIPLAIKVINVEEFDRQDLQRVQRECQIGGKLEHHEHLVHVRDAFERDGTLFIVMELVEGDTVKKYLKEHSKVDFQLALTWALDLIDVLIDVHEQNVIHRDIKPQNILLTDDGEVKLTDFGIAHLPESDITKDYQPGTYAYRSPEQEKNEAVDEKTDVYSLCAVLFEVWTGAPFHPYRGFSLAELRAELKARLQQQYPDQPDEILELLTKVPANGLQNERSQRATLMQLQAGLQKIQRTLETTTSDPAATDSLAQAREQVSIEMKKGRRQTVVSSVIQPPVAHRSEKAAEDTLLTQWVEEGFSEWFLRGETNNIVLWFDPEQEWEPLLPHFPEQFPLLRYEGSVLELRYKLEKRGEDTQRSRSKITSYFRV